MYLRVRFSGLWANYNVKWPETILLQMYFQLLGKQNNPHHLYLSWGGGSNKTRRRLWFMWRIVFGWR
jgi:hypothetical protein